MEINKVSIVTLALLLLTSCVSRDPNAGGNCASFERVRIDETENKKVLYFNRKIMVNKLGAHGWEDSITYSYNIVIPLGRIRNYMNPMVTGPDMEGECFGYIIFNEEKREITLRLRQVQYQPGVLFDPNHGGGAQSLPVIGDIEVPINGVYHIDNPDVFK